MDSLTVIGCISEEEDHCLFCLKSPRAFEGITRVSKNLKKHGKAEMTVSLCELIKPHTAR